MRRIGWSCEGLTSVHNKYTGYTLKHLLLRHLYNLPLPMLMCQALCSETSYWRMLSGQVLTSKCSLTLYCVVTYTLLGILGPFNHAHGFMLSSLQIGHCRPTPAKKQSVKPSLQRRILFNAMYQSIFNVVFYISFYENFGTTIKVFGSKST